MEHRLMANGSQIFFLKKITRYNVSFPLKLLLWRLFLKLNHRP